MTMSADIQMLWKAFTNTHQDVDANNEHKPEVKLWYGQDNNLHYSVTLYGNSISDYIFFMPDFFLKWHIKRAIKKLINIHCIEISTGMVE